MRVIEISYHKLQEIKLLFKLHIQIASINEITWLTSNMRFCPMEHQYEIKADKHLQIWGN